MHGYEPVTLSRGVQAIRVPSGDRIILPKGMQVIITQALGGSFTIYIEGNLFRVAGADADAVGKEPIKAPPVPENASDKDIESIVWDQMRTCYDPEIPINIVDLGLVYRCEIEGTGTGGRIVHIAMTLTAPGCGMGPILMEDVKEKVEIIPTVEEAEVELVFDPPWNASMMTDEARLQAGLL